MTGFSYQPTKIVLRRPLESALATVLDAVDIGYRVVVVRDAICSSSDKGHEMPMRLYHAGFTEQIETADAQAVLARWE